MGPRVRPDARKTHSPARQALGRAPHFRGSGPRPALQRHQHRKARGRRRPSLRGHPPAELSGFPMKVFRRLAILLLLGLAAGGYVIYRLEQPYQNFAGATFVEFSRGTGSRAMAVELARAGVVRSEWEFLLARYI